MELRIHPEALAALKRLKDDGSRVELYRNVLRTVVMIRDDPGSREARLRSARASAWGQVWIVPVRDREQDWIVIWTPEEPEVVHVIYVGPDP